jgi:hypothetical protein
MLTYANVCSRKLERRSKSTRVSCFRTSSASLPRCIRLYMCPHTAKYVSSYYYICVLMLLHMRLVQAAPRCRGVYAYICVRILLYMCPHTTIYAFCPSRPRCRGILSNSGYLLYSYKSTKSDAGARMRPLSRSQVLKLLALLVQKYKY